MQNLRLKNWALLVVAFVMAVTMSACLGNDDATSSLGVQDEPILTGLCNSGWVIDSIGSKPALELEYQKIVFELDGTGMHTVFNAEKQALESTAFTWKSYAYSGAVHTLMMQYEGYDYPSQLFYTILSNGRMRFAGQETYYQFKPTGF